MESCVLVDVDESESNNERERGSGDGRVALWLTLVKVEAKTHRTRGNGVSQMTRSGGKQEIPLTREINSLCCCAYNA